MYQHLTALILRLLRVPPEPQPPHGDPVSLRVFRAGRNFYKLRLLKWSLAQLAALAGIIFWFGVFSDLGEKVEERRLQNARSAPAAQPAPSAPAPAPSAKNFGETIDAKAKEFAAVIDKEGRQNWDKSKKKKWRPMNSFYAWRSGMVGFLSHLPRPAMLVIWFFEISGLILYVVQLPVTFLIARMDYELRWYMVTDRSLRIRHGVWKIAESTMSFANIQQVAVSQGPIQRLLGLSDVKVETAGGGNGGGPEHKAGEDDMHLGLFHSVTNAEEIRDLILKRLRRFRESGLGDPEENDRPHEADAPAVSADLLAAARELAAEARTLRATLG